MKNILLYLLLASNFLFAQENTNEISAKLEDFFPDKKIAVKKLDPNGLRSLINAHLEASPYLKQLESNIQSSDEQSNAMQAFLSPKLNFNLGINGYDSYFREVYVYENIPIAYDDQNPIISNINLPNGGEGIIWLPRPTEYALRDIPLTASEKYYSYVANSSAGLYYKFPFGLQINAFNVALKYRGLPKNYGYPWSADISTSFNLPIFKSFGYYGQPENISIENQKISNDILLKSKISSKNSVVFGIITNYFSLLSEYDKINVIDSLIALNNIQRSDIDLLASKNRVTVSDVINVKSVTNRYKVQKQDALNQAAYYSGMLNPDPFVDSEVILYEASSIDYAGLISKMKSCRFWFFWIG